MGFPADGGHRVRMDGLFHITVYEYDETSPALVHQFLMVVTVCEWMDYSVSQCTSTTRLVLHLCINSSEILKCMSY